MNKHGRLAISHRQKTDPDRYQQIQNPDTFFQELGERAEIETSSSKTRSPARTRRGNSVLIPGPQAQEDDEEEEEDLEGCSQHKPKRCSGLCPSVPRRV